MRREKYFVKKHCVARKKAHQTKIIIVGIGGIKHPGLMGSFVGRGRLRRQPIADGLPIMAVAARFGRGFT